ncbi:type VI secretion system baseplate subunit TssE [Escherichia coli]|nr:type VI secretion system baseplate subunit TssE [Escherichia coli]
MNKSYQNGDSGDLLRHGYRSRRTSLTISAHDKMQPSLLDRLTDNAPGRRQEPARHSLVSHSALRRQVLRDLQWLFNTINSEAQQDLSRMEHVRRSVFNFGVAPLAGRRMSEIDQEDIRQQLTRAILNFEPRILPQGLQVRCVCDTTSLKLHNVLSIEIKGRLWCVPWPLEFLFRTDVDLENGHFSLKDVG